MRPHHPQATGLCPDAARHAVGKGRYGPAVVRYGLPKDLRVPLALGLLQANIHYHPKARERILGA